MTISYLHTILFIDDDLDWHNIAKELCKSAGYHMESAFTVTEALVQCQRLSPLPILALVDLHLSGFAPQNTHVTFDGERLFVPFRNLDVHFINSSPVESEYACTVWGDRRPVRNVGAGG